MRILAVRAAPSLQQTKRQLQSVHEKLTRQQRQQTMRREAFDARVKTLRHEHSVLAGEHLAQQRQVQDLDELISRTEMRVCAGRRRGERERDGAKACDGVDRPAFVGRAIADGGPSAAAPARARRHACRLRAAEAGRGRISRSAGDGDGGVGVAWRGKCKN